MRPLLRVAGDTCLAIRLNLRVTADSGGQLFWTTESSPEFDEQRTIRFPVIPDGRFHEYRIDVGQHPAWKGQTITGLRLDPCGGAGRASSTSTISAGTTCRPRQATDREAALTRFPNPCETWYAAQGGHAR